VIRHAIACALCLIPVAVAAASPRYKPLYKPESFDKILSYRLNTVLNQELANRGWLNNRPIYNRPIYRTERVSPCVTVVWTTPPNASGPLRQNLLYWDKLVDGEPSNNGHYYWIDFVYDNNKPNGEIVAIPFKDDPKLEFGDKQSLESTTYVLQMTCQGPHP